MKINLSLNEERVRECTPVLLAIEHMIGKVAEYVFDKQFSDMKNYHIEFLFHYYTFQMFLNKFIDQGKADEICNAIRSFEGRMTVR